MTVTIMRGISGSGKTTHACTLAQSTGALIVSRDIIRQQFGDTGKTVFNQEVEKLVTQIEVDQVREALYRGLDVVVDDSNLHHSSGRKFANLAHTLGHEFEVVDVLTSKDLELCIKRSNIPTEAVVRQYSKWLMRKPIKATVDLIEPVEMDLLGQTAYIFDVDGTLASINPDNPRDVYDGSRAGEDLVDDSVSRIVDSLDYSDVYVLVATGRSAEHRDVTESWLVDKGIKFDQLYTRSLNDNRPDAQVKYEILQQIAHEGYYVCGVFDDREQVVDMWRTAGIKTFDVGQGRGKF